MQLSALGTRVRGGVVISELACKLLGRKPPHKEGTQQKNRERELSKADRHVKYLHIYFSRKSEQPVPVL